MSLIRKAIELLGSGKITARVSPFTCKYEYQRYCAPEVPGDMVGWFENKESD